jgi:type II secretion system protein C
MKNLFKPEYLKKAITLLTLLLVLKLLWFVVQVTLLSPVDIDEAEAQTSKALYYRVKLTPNEAPAPQKVVAKPTKKISGSIKEIKLLAIYNASDISVVTVEHRKKTKVLGSGESINGFVLEGAGSNFAMFSKDNKNYKVMLIKNSKLETSASSITPSRKPAVSSSTEAIGEVTNEGSVKIIDRSLLDHYAKNMDDIYKNIGVSEIKEGKDLQGFKINFVRKDSPFAKLGIRRDDVIKSINGQEIKTHKAAMDVYKTLNDVESLNLVIMRGKEEMELEYEIN